MHAPRQFAWYPASPTRPPSWRGLVDRNGKVSSFAEHLDIVTRSPLRPFRIGDQEGIAARQGRDVPGALGNQRLDVRTIGAEPGGQEARDSGLLVKRALEPRAHQRER